MSTSDAKVMEIMMKRDLKNDSRYTSHDYQMHIKMRRNFWFL